MGRVAVFVVVVVVVAVAVAVLAVVGGDSIVVVLVLHDDRKTVVIVAGLMFAFAFVWDSAKTVWLVMVAANTVAVVVVAVVVVVGTVQSIVFADGAVSCYAWIANRNCCVGCGCHTEILQGEEKRPQRLRQQARSGGLDWEGGV